MYLFFFSFCFCFFCFTKSVSDDFAQGYTVVTKAPIKVEIDFKNEDFVTDDVSLTSKWGIFHLWLLGSRRSGSRMFLIFEKLTWQAITRGPATLLFTKVCPHVCFRDSRVPFCNASFFYVWNCFNKKCYSIVWLFLSHFPLVCHFTVNSKKSWSRHHKDFHENTVPEKFLFHWACSYQWQSE